MDKKQSTMETILRNLGIFLLVLGFLNLILFGVGVYQDLSLTHPILYFSIMILSFAAIYSGFMFFRFNIWIACWLEDVLTKKIKP